MINVFWLRRDLRLRDNHGLFRALTSGLPVQLLFIFDTNILNKLERKNDARVTFIYNVLKQLNESLNAFGSSILVEHGRPEEIFRRMTEQHQIHEVYANEDYEPYALQRDFEVSKLLNEKGIAFKKFKDHVMFAPGEVLKDDGKPYTVFTPFSKRWKSLLTDEKLRPYPSEDFLHHTVKLVHPFPELNEIGFSKSSIPVPHASLDVRILRDYAQNRNTPSIEGTTKAGVHLRFGTMSIRKSVSLGRVHSETWLNELIWREFFMHILFHFPQSATENFNARYNRLQWRNDEEAFNRWCQGKTGFPLVDAGMRELVNTGFMHNRVRMVTASFLTKHLLIDWRWGEAFFASHLLDFELASNVGNWQWVAGTGCDAAPYFRIFNPSEQLKKFDPELEYVRKWVGEINDMTYKPMIDHSFARNRAISTYLAALE